MDFIRDLVPNKVSTKHIKHFFELYCNKSKAVEKKSESEEESHRPKIKSNISIRAFAFNYSKFKKSETEIINIMSDKAMKGRYTELKRYLNDFLAHYH